jgi:hypothetical protein
MGRRDSGVDSFQCPSLAVSLSQIVLDAFFTIPGENGSTLVEIRPLA